MMTTAHDAPSGSSGRIINVRKLVALDIALHGTRFIVGEFAIGIALGAALRVWLAVSGLPLGHAASAFKLVLGAYFLCLALNYVPMLLYAIVLARSQSARREVAGGGAGPGGRAGQDAAPGLGAGGGVGGSGRSAGGGKSHPRGSGRRRPPHAPPAAARARRGPARRRSARARSRTRPPCRSSQHR